MEDATRMQATDPPPPGVWEPVVTPGGGRRPRTYLPAGLTLNGKWELVEHLASGCKGDVYLADQLNLERRVAVKILSPDVLDYFKGYPKELETEVIRFHREVQAMAGVRHPNVLQVFDFDKDEHGGLPLSYLVMEYIPGPTLRSRMPAEGMGLDKDRVARWIHDYFLPVLRGVSAVHAAGVVHRDIKPDNILLDGDTPKLADFGLARIARKEGLTGTFDLIGTVYYMPNEQFMTCGQVDARADVYALGKILFELINGRHANDNRVIFKQVGVTREPSPPELDEFFTRLDAIIRASTCEEPNGRTSSAMLLYKCLRGLVASEIEGLEPGTLKSRRSWAVYGPIITVLLIGIICLVTYHVLFPTELALQAPR